jgi:hypothetical protein
MTLETNLRQFSRALLIISLLILTIFTTLQFPLVKAQPFSGPQQVPMGTPFSTDSKLMFVDSGPANNTSLKRDSLIKYVDVNSNGHWDAGEPVVYDSNNDSVFESIEIPIAGTVSIGTMLKTDPLVKYVDINGNNNWDPGEAVVYASNAINNNVYIVGESVIAGTPLVSGTAIVSDSHVKFVGLGTSWISGNSVVYDSNLDGSYSASVDSHIKYFDTNGNNHWDPLEPVVNDINLNGIYDSGEPVLYGAAPSVGATLKSDPNLKFVDANRNGVWDSGEAIVYDSNANGLLDAGEPVIVTANPPILAGLSSDTKVKYVDSNSNNVWNPGETVVYDTISKGFFNATVDTHIKYFDANGNGIYDTGDSVVYDSNGNGIYDTGEKVIAGPTPPTDGSATLTFDQHFHFVDTNLDGRWDIGETVVYDTNLDHVYETGELVVAGTAPTNGTFLTEPIIAGARPTVGTALKTDSKLKYLETTGNVVWNPGEAVVYDTNSNNLYDTGEPVITGTSPQVGTLLSEPLIAGTIPTIGTLLKSDSKLKFIDAAGTGLWNPGETVVYDNNGNGSYDQGESVLADGAPGSGVWKPGEVVVYDSNNNSLYNSGEPVAAGTAPLNKTAIRRDTLVKYVDANANGHWDPGETVAYDTNNNNVYDPGDSTIAGSGPPLNLYLSPSVAEDYFGRIWLSWSEKPIGSNLNPIIYFKTGNGSATSWSPRQAVTTGSSNDVENFVSPLVNQSMILLWSSNRTGHPQIFYRLYTVSGGIPVATMGPVQLTSTPSLLDRTPSAVQDRNGRIWVTWTRQNAQATLSQIWYKYYNGTSWSSDFLLTPSSSPGVGAKSPFIAQTKDGLIRLLWSDNSTSNLNLFYTTTNGTVTSVPTGGISSWPNKIAFPAFSGSNDDDHPVMVQSRDGTYWIFFQRSILSPNSENIYFSTATDSAGAIWSNATQIPSSSIEDSIPTAVQNSDHKVWIFWNSLVSSALQIYASSTGAISSVNDIGLRVLNVTPRLIRSGYPVNITSVVTNYGDSTESATLILVANTTSNVLKTWTLSIAPGLSQTFYFNWTNPAWGRYTILASLTTVSPVENIVNQKDDSLAFGPLRVSPPGDANGDGQVNILDLALIAFCWNQTPTPGTMCNQYVDVDNDGKPIGILDLAQAAFYFGKSV